jgi:hypothetical protein
MNTEPNRPSVSSSLLSLVKEERSDSTKSLPQADEDPHPRRSLRTKFEKNNTIKYVGEYIKDCQNKDVYVLTAVGAQKRHSLFEDHVRNFLGKREGGASKSEATSSPSSKSKIRSVKKELVDSPVSSASNTIIPSDERSTLIQSEIELSEAWEHFSHCNTSRDNRGILSELFLESTRTIQGEISSDQLKEFDKLARIPLILDRFVIACHGVQLLIKSKVSGILRINPCIESTSYRHDNIDVTFNVQTRGTRVLVSKAGGGPSITYNSGDYFTLHRGIFNLFFSSIIH